MDRFSAVRTFLRVVETGSFTKAADSLDMPRNMVTKQIQALEGHLRTKLFNRTTRRVSVTSEGEAYYQRMTRVLEDWDEAEAELAATQNRPRGRLRADLPSALATQLVIPALPTFFSRYPDLQLELGVSDRPTDMIGDRVDCILRAGKISDQSLVVRQIGELPFVLCASKDYLSRYGTPKRPDDLSNGHVVVRYFFAGTGRRLTFTLRKGSDEVTAQARDMVAVNDANALLAAGVAGLGIVRIPALVAQPYLDAGKLIPILRDWSMETVAVSVVFAPNRHLSARMRVFVDWLIEIFNAHPQAKRSSRRVV